MVQGQANLQIFVQFGVYILQIKTTIGNLFVNLRKKLLSDLIAVLFALFRMRSTTSGTIISGTNVVLELVFFHDILHLSFPFHWTVTFKVCIV